MGWGWGVGGSMAIATRYAEEYARETKELRARGFTEGRRKGVLNRVHFSSVQVGGVRRLWPRSIMVYKT